MTAYYKPGDVWRGPLGECRRILRVEPHQVAYIRFWETAAAVTASKQTARRLAFDLWCAKANRVAEGPEPERPAAEKEFDMAGLLESIDD